MAVLGLRVQAIHRNADRARLETETLRALSQTDALTGLPNRRGLQDRLQLALESATPQQMLAVFLLDLDGFKPVNDRYGHDVGDALLVAVGKRLQQQLRGSDVVARLGGDEFVVLASGLADALHGSGVLVQTVKPGPTRTPMTADYKGPGVLLSDPARVARTVVRGIVRGRGTVYAPGYWRLIMAIIRALPEFLARKVPG